MPFRSRQRGFSLIELLIALMVLGALTAIALPSYRGYILRSHRVDAVNALMKTAAAQEAFYLQNNTYTDDLTSASPDGLGLEATVEGGRYSLEIDSADDEGFELTATAIAEQAADTDCPSFTLDERGTRGGNAECWVK